MGAEGVQDNLHNQRRGTTERYSHLRRTDLPQGDYVLQQKIIKERADMLYISCSLVLSISFQFVHEIISISIGRNN